MLIKLSMVAAAILATQQAPIAIAARPVIQQQGFAIPTSSARTERLRLESRALVARAQQVPQTYRPTPGQPSRAEIAAARERLESALDSMSEMSEMDSMQLQTAMDRLSKAMSTLSNVLKKASDTDQAIITHIK